MQVLAVARYSSLSGTNNKWLNKDLKKTPMVERVLPAYGDLVPRQAHLLAGYTGALLVDGCLLGAGSSGFVAIPIARVLASCASSLTPGGIRI